MTRYKVKDRNGNFVEVRELTTAKAAAREWCTDYQPKVYNANGQCLYVYTRDEGRQRWVQMQGVELVK